MSKNPKLSVYQIILKPTSKKKLKTYTFREFFLKKYDLDEKTSDKKIFNTLFKDIFKVHEYNDNLKRRKAFRLGKDISKSPDNFYIQGTVEGGSYDSGKTSGNRKTKRESKKFGKNIIIQDDFYFLMQTKLDEKVGILILQTYGQENIDDVFKPFIANIFKHQGESYKAILKQFIPESIKDLAKETAIVSELNYQTKDLTINQLSEKDNLEAKFHLKITLTPVDQSVPLHRLGKWREAIGKSLIKLPNKELSLDDFNAKSGYLKSETLKNPAKFEINKDLVSIKPTIYLEKIDEVAIEDNGTPVWDTLKDYCSKELLPELEHEIYE